MSQVPNEESVSTEIKQKDKDFNFFMNIALVTSILSSVCVGVGTGSYFLGIGVLCGFVCGAGIVFACKTLDQQT